ncbi:MAG: hypothetical protein JNL09_08575 [Anaerolineales bacterium]|nr:hypothetical protein [Anaerolineales bacterium]
MNPELEAHYTCPACGFIVFTEPAGSYEICPICNWEDDAVQLVNPTAVVGANHESLVAYQRRALAQLPIALQAYENFRRDPAWRPLNETDYASVKDKGESGLDYFQALETGQTVYYWQCGL